MDVNLKYLRPMPAATRVLYLFIFMLICCFNTTAQTGFEMVENKGQWPEKVLYSLGFESGRCFGELDGFTYHIFDLSPIEQSHNHEKSAVKDELRNSGHVYKVKFLQCNAQSPLIKTGTLQSTFNYFLGNDPSHWAGNCMAFSEMKREGLYPFINLHHYFNQGQLKYDFIVSPNGDASQIQMQYSGLDKMKLENGRLILTTSVGKVIEQKPIAWQMIKGQKRMVECEYKLTDSIVGFYFPQSYHRQYELVIDPELLFSTYSGSTDNNFGYTATYDEQGYLYSGSSAFGQGYPTTIGAYQTVWGGGDGQGTLTGTDIAIAKYDVSGTFMVWSTFIGGQGDELPHSLICNNNNELIVFGSTSSSDFPVSSGAFDSSFNGGTGFIPSGVGVDYVNGADIILSKLSANGSALLGSTYFGGSENDGVNASTHLKFNYADEFRGEVEIDQNGNIWIASATNSPDLPMQNAFDSNLSGSFDGVIAQFSADLNTLQYSSYVGGNEDDCVYSIAFASDNSAFICGGTYSTDLGATTDAYQSSFQGGAADGWIARLNNTNYSPEALTYFGSEEYEQTFFVELDSEEEVLIYGQTLAAGNTFILNAAHSNLGGSILISSFNYNLTELQWSTVLGTNNSKIELCPTAFTVDRCGTIYASGWGGGPNFTFLTSDTNPYNDTAFELIENMDVTDDAFQSSTDGSDFYVFALEESASSLLYASYFGGDLSGEHVDGGTSRFDPQGIMYQSVCAGCGGNDDFPIYPSNAVSAVNNASCNNGVFKLFFGLNEPIADFEVNTQGCLNVPVAPNNQSIIAETYLWNFGDETTSTEVNPIHQYSAPGVYEIQLIATDPGCGLSDTTTQTVTITDFNGGNFTATATPDVILPGSSSQLNVTPGGYPFVWTPDGTLNNATIQSPVATPTETTTYNVNVSDGICETNVYVTVRVVEFVCGPPNIYIPNAFTPNKDDRNEKLYVRANFMDDIYFVIYDRWGEKVFESTSLNDGWDGFFNGKELDPDVYVYYLEATCAGGTKYFDKGNITLIR